jgi:pantoate--beta-alanine ligase
MSDTYVFESMSSFIQLRDQFKPIDTFGLVPTMGALHEGHASLIKKSVSENTHTVVSIYVNPTQFNNPEDLKKYPRTWEEDVALVQEAGASFIIAPRYEEIYADGYRYQLTEKDLSKKLEGLHRPGHFDGVLTVVMKLLQIAQPDKAYFGEKDYQQFQLIKDMAQSFFMRSEIIGCATVRESDGLAMSSRNKRLTPEGRKNAALIYKTLNSSVSFNQAKEALAASQIELEYLEEYSNRRYIAAFVDGVRLIDNVAV